MRYEGILVSLAEIEAEADELGYKVSGIDIKYNTRFFHVEAEFIDIDPADVDGDESEDMEHGVVHLNRELTLAGMVELYNRLKEKHGKEVRV